MELEIIRSYHEEGVNGSLYIDGVLQCFTIELPWRNNEPRRSCIPEGRYLLRKRYSPKFKHHMQIVGVEGRSLILIHPANDAKKELYGCIAPVSVHQGPGKGALSKIAFDWIKTLVYQRMRKEDVFIHIKANQDDNRRKSKSTNTKVFQEGA